MHDAEELERASKVFQALSNAARLKILLMVSETKRPLHIKAVARKLEMDYGAVYRHVKVLEDARLLEIYEVGRSRVLSVTHIELVKQFIENAREITQ